MRKWLFSPENEKGQVLPIVLVALVVGSFLVLPSLRSVSTSIKAGEGIKANEKGLYAAEAGIQDAAWKLTTGVIDPSDIEGYYTYTLPDTINNNTVNVTISYANELSGVAIGVGPHTTEVSESYSYNGDVYTYQLTLLRGVMGNIKIDWIMLDIPAGLAYVSGLPSGNITEDGLLLTVLPEPTATTSPAGRTTLNWVSDASDPLFFMKGGATYVLTLILRGDPGLDPTNGQILLRTVRSDIGDITDYWPLVIKAEASDSRGLQASIQAGAWLSQSLTDFVISDWEISP